MSALLAGCHAMLGASNRARRFAVECVERKPDFTIGRLLAKLPFREQADAVHIA